MRIHNHINYRSQADIYVFHDVCVCAMMFPITKVFVKLIHGYICMNEDHKKFNSL